MTALQHLWQLLLQMQPDRFLMHCTLLCTTWDDVHSLHGDLYTVRATWVYWTRLLQIGSALTAWLSRPRASLPCMLLHTTSS